MESEVTSMVYLYALYRVKYGLQAHTRYQVPVFNIELVRKA